MCTTACARSLKKLLRTNWIEQDKKGDQRRDVREKQSACRQWRVPSG